MGRKAFLSSLLVFLILPFVSRPSAGQTAAATFSESSHCSVTCTGDYYACCNTSLNECQCVENSLTRLCDSGGKGSSSCSTGKSTSFKSIQSVLAEEDHLKAFLDSLAANPPTFDDRQREAYQGLLDFLSSTPEP